MVIKSQLKYGIMAQSQVQEIELRILYGRDWDTDMSLDHLFAPKFRLIHQNIMIHTLKLIVMGIQHGTQELSVMGSLLWGERSLQMARSSTVGNH